MQFRSALAAVVVSLAATVAAHADLDTAKQYLTEASDLVARGSSYFEDASGKLELAEASLDDVSGAEKDAVLAKIKALRDQIASGANAEQKAILKRKLDRAIEDAEEAIGNLAIWSRSADEYRELIDGEETKKLFTADELAPYQKKFAMFEKLHKGKALKENLGVATNAVEQLEASWAERKAVLADADASPNSKSGAVEDTARDLQSIERYFKELPADNADVVALRARVTRISDEVSNSASEEQVAEVLERIKSGTELYKDEFDGMEGEGAAPTWEQFCKTSSEAVSRLNVPKTINFIDRTSRQLEYLVEDEAYQAVKGNPKVKAAVDELETKLAAAKKKVAANVQAIMEEFEKATLTADNETNANSLKWSVESALGQDSDEAKECITRIDKKLEALAAATTGAAEAKAAAYRQMKADAEAAWPEILAKYEPESGFDPNDPAAFKGKIIKIETDNLMGYRFRPNDFPFATTLNGKAVAAVYSDKVKQAIDEVEGKLGRGVGDSDDDGRWTIIARVNGNTGQLLQKLEHEGDVTVDGSRVGTVRETEIRPVEAPIITIIAAHCGPLTVGE